MKTPLKKSFAILTLAVLALVFSSADAFAAKKKTKAAVAPTASSADTMATSEGSSRTKDLKAGPLAHKAKVGDKCTKICMYDKTITCAGTLVDFNGSLQCGLDPKCCVKPEESR